MESNQQEHGSYNKDDGHIDSGYRVVGPNTSSGALTRWYFPTLEYAKKFAKQLCEDQQLRPFAVTGTRYGDSDISGSIEILKFIGRWRPKKQPVEYLEASDD